MRQTVSRMLAMALLIVISFAGWFGIALGQTPLAGPLALPSTLDQWTAVVGILLPLAIAVINRTAWESPLKAIAAVGVCMLAAAGEVAVKGQFDLKHWSQNALAVFFLTVTTYYGFWKPTGIADAVEKRTG